MYLESIIINFLCNNEHENNMQLLLYPHRPVMTYRCPDPLTSVAFLAGGQRVALGTMTGKVFVHDLRSLRPPLATLSAHTSDVTNIRLQPLLRSKVGISEKFQDDKYSLKSVKGVILAKHLIKGRGKWGENYVQ